MRRALVVLMVVAAAGSWPLVASPASTSQAGRSVMVVDPGLRADFNGDGAADLAIGVPGEDLDGGLTSAGGVQVLYGSAFGLSGSGSQFFAQGADGVPNSPE
jgi:FG-GAP repeat